METNKLILKKVKVHNLQDVDLTLPKNALIVFTGVSGSGKSSLAFDTIYIEGQRRYIESLSTHARKYLGDLPKPNAKKITGISPTIAIEQKTIGKTPRSTVGTMTGIYDLLRVVFAKIGMPHCPISHEPVQRQSSEKILQQIQALSEGAKIIFLSSYAKNKKSSFKEDFSELLRKGFTRVRVDGEIRELVELDSLDHTSAHTVEIVMDRLINVKENISRIKEAVETSLDVGKGYFSIYNVSTQEEIPFSKYAFSPKSGMSYPPLSAQDFSFNHPEGMCLTCQGLGVHQEFALDKIIDPEKSIAEDCCQIASSNETVRYGNIYRNLAKMYKFSLKTPWKKLSKKAKDVFLYGIEQKWSEMEFIHPVKKTRWIEYVNWKGVIHEAHARLNAASSDLYKQKMHAFMNEQICPSCIGARIRPYPAAAELCGRTIYQLTQMSIYDLSSFFETIHINEKDLYIVKELIKEIQQKILFLLNVGVGYLTLGRSSPTLSGGESQRIRLASHIGSGLAGSIYILDEPSIGLHPSDHHKLIATLQNLKMAGNTVIVVEHDADTIEQADVVVDVGPLAGKYGGHILSCGTVEDLKKSPNSLTAKYLTNALSISTSKTIRKVKFPGIKIFGASHHNLKNINVEIPLKGLICITGVSGSGKSSLISDILYPSLANHLHKAQLSIGTHKKIEGIENIDKVIFVDQSPIGRTPRSNLSTYIKLFDDIRSFFCQLPESMLRGYTPGHFSFNVKEGSCPYCAGLGLIKMDMDFMEDQWITCRQCKGKRFSEEVLFVTYQGKNIYDILDMDVESAAKLFAKVPHIYKKLDLLLRVGLGYLQLGQPSTTLSGGEAQRIKLAKELVRAQSGNTLYILDEPTTGLHFHDIHKLLEIFSHLLHLGNTILVIEHNIDLMKCSDWIIDIGPSAGDRGGKVIFEGPVDKILKADTLTADALRKSLVPHKEKPQQSKQTVVPTQAITVRHASQNTLQNVSLSIPKNQITVFTGPSGSGKTSLAFDTIFAEGQRRYIASLPPYARQIVKQMPKPDVEKIEGLSPSIAIEQKKGAVNPRSTIGTITEIYDFLRILFSHMAVPYCPETQEKIQTISKEYVVEKILQLPAKSRICVLAPIKNLKADSFDEFIRRMNREGYLRIRLNGKYYEIDEPIPYLPSEKNSLFVVMDRLVIEDKAKLRLLDAVERAVKKSEQEVVFALDDRDIFFNLSFCVEKTGKSYPPITPQTFSFNSQYGMCEECQGIGTVFGMDVSSDRDLMKSSIQEIFSMLLKQGKSKKSIQIIEKYFSQLKIDPKLPIKKLANENMEYFLYGKEKNCEFEIQKGVRLQFKGIFTTLAKFAKIAHGSFKEALIPLMEERICPICEGERLNPLARNARLKGISLPKLCNKSLNEVSEFFHNLILSTKEKTYLQETYDLIIKKLSFLLDIGLGYLSLSRTAPSLSGGEMQRIRLATQLGSFLTNCIYVLDEPTIGLHPHNTDLLLLSLQKLKNLQNTIILIEHDTFVMQSADHLVEFGPKAGVYGGKIIAEGTYPQICANENSTTGQYISGKKTIPIPKSTRKIHKYLSIKNATAHNLKNISIDIPLEVITCITGVSGSGKSTLMHDVIKAAMKKALETHKAKKKVMIDKCSVEGCDLIDKLIVITQNPIGSTIRADIFTYSDLSSPIRAHFSQMPLAKSKGLSPKHFSYHHKSGMCKTCWGLGYKTIDLQFMPSVKVRCDACLGQRLNPLSLEVEYKGKNLGQVLDLTVQEAKEFFTSIPPIVKKLDILCKVGLDYVKLGQELFTLSGGEAQRLRLSRELGKRSTGRTLFIIDEPSTGLYFDDIVKLLHIFHELADKKNSFIIIEHNLDIIANADYIIDLGPEAGKNGGHIVAKGTLNDIIKTKGSYTGKYLSQHLLSLRKTK